MMDRVKIQHVDATGRQLVTEITAIQDWARTAWSLSKKVNDLAEPHRLSMLKASLPSTILDIVPITSSSTIESVIRDILSMPTEQLKRAVDRDRRLEEMERAFRTIKTSQPIDRPSSAPPVSSQPQGFRKGYPVEGDKHLTFPNTREGRASWRQACAQLASVVPTAYTPYPLTPGTDLPGRDVCNRCGMSGHLSNNCSSDSPLSANEQRFRRQVSAAVRDKAKTANAVQMTDTTPDSSFFSSDPADEAPVPKKE